MLIVDIRRPVSPRGFKLELRREPSSDVFAFSPLAAWLLEQEGKRFKTRDEIVPPQWFKEEGMLNFSRLGDIFSRVFGDEADSWRGLTFELKMVLDYAFMEERRWLAIESGGGRVLSDVPQASRESISCADHLGDRAALYFWAVPPERFVQIPRRSEWAGQWIARFRRMDGHGIRRRLCKFNRAFLSARGPTLITSFAYDWEAYRLRLEKHFRAIPADQLAQEALGLESSPHLPQELEKQLELFRDAVRTRFSGILPRTLAHVLRIMTPRLRRYAQLRGALAKNILLIAERHDVRAALSTACATQEDFLVNYYLKNQGYPTVFYQHGGYNGQSLVEHDAEIVPATHSFVYGDADAAFFKRVRPGQKIIQAGCPALARLGEDMGRCDRFLYVLYFNAGNSRCIRGPDDTPLMDETALFRRHRQIIDLFARYPKKRLYLRQHPAQWEFLYEPLGEYIRQRKIRNVFFDDSPGPTQRYLRGYEGIILDYISTTILYALAMKKKLACYLGEPGGINAEAKRLLPRVAACSDTESGFVASLETWINEGPPKIDDDARKELLSLYGGGLQAEQSGAWSHLKQVLKIAGKS